MTPRILISRLDKAIAGYGQSVTLQRTAVDNTTGGLTVAAEITCAAKFRTFGPQDLAAGEVQDISVVLSPTGLGSFGVPSRDDRIILGGNPSNIEQIAPLYYGGVLCRVNLLCRG
jgi:hypothetical protein